MSVLTIDLIALALMAPLATVPFRRDADRDAVFWGALGLATVAALVASLVQVGGQWNSGLAQTLWVSIGASMVLYAVFAIMDGQAWRLTPILMPYLLVLGLIGTVWGEAGPHPMQGGAPDAWVAFHILVGVVTYGLLTLAAVAGVAAFLSERALKRKRPTGLTRVLPSVADSESLSTRLLIAAEVVLGLGLVSGMTVLLFETGELVRFDHKTLLSFLAFVVIGGLLLGRHFTGMRGRAAARIVMLAYLLLTLGYPGVKFVTEVLM